MKNRFRIVLGETCPRRAAATGPIKTDAGQYSQKLAEEKAQKKSSPARLAQNLFQDSPGCRA